MFLMEVLSKNGNVCNFEIWKCMVVKCDYHSTKTVIFWYLKCCFIIDCCSYLLCIMFCIFFIIFCCKFCKDGLTANCFLLALGQVIFTILLYTSPFCYCYYMYLSLKKINKLESSFTNTLCWKGLKYMFTNDS